MKALSIEIRLFFFQEMTENLRANFELLLSLFFHRRVHVFATPLVLKKNSFHKKESEVVPFLIQIFFEKKTLHHNIEEPMFLNEEEEEEEKKLETFSSSSCYNKEWVSLVNKPQKLNTLLCCLCNEIANNAMELQCDEHEDAEQTYLVGEECLQNYLKQNNEKCPIKQHDHCKFSKNRVVRQQTSELLVICPRQYNAQKSQSNEEITPGEKEDYESELRNKCNFKGKIKEVENHLKSCQLMTIQQIISSFKELQLQFEIEKVQAVLSFMEKKIEQLKENDNKQTKQIQQLNVRFYCFEDIFVNMLEPKGFEFR
ncbi:hypothetical protein RFI_23223, partial [Reticulomyxa filosa]